MVVFYRGSPCLGFGRQLHVAEAATGCSDALRFQLELEFLQSLANPRYINCEPC